ncbi:tetratricopeptide repeat protein [Streptomyces sp. NPDC055607]
MRVGDQTIHELLELSLKALDIGDEKAARDFAVQAETMSSDVLNTANSALVHGYVELESGNLGAALEKFDRSASLASEHLDEPAGVSLHLNASVAMGMTHRSRGDYAIAERILVTAVRQTEQIAAPSDLVAAYNELGVLFKYYGKFDLSSKYYELAFEHLRGFNSVELATLYHNIAGLAHARGDYAAAETPARKAISMRTEILGADHPDVAADCAALAPILAELDRLQEAEGLNRRALRIFEQFYGNNHYETAVAAGNLAAILHRQGCREEARAYYERSLRVLEEELGPLHPELAPVLNNLADLLAEQDPDASRALLSRALKALTSASVDADHPTLTSVRHSIDAM